MGSSVGGSQDMHQDGAREASRAQNVSPSHVRAELASHDPESERLLKVFWGSASLNQSYPRWTARRINWQLAGRKIGLVMVSLHPHPQPASQHHLGNR